MQPEHQYTGWLAQTIPGDCLQVEAMIIFACIFLAVFVYSVLMLDACMKWALQFAFFASLIASPVALLAIEIYGVAK